MKQYFIILFAVTFLSSCDIVVIHKKKTVDAIQKSLERAYFEGQKDALNGDVRIKLNPDSCYFWVKSPWDCGDAPTYTPTYLDSKTNN